MVIYRIEVAGPALKAGRATLDSTADDMTWNEQSGYDWVLCAIQMDGQQRRAGQLDGQRREIGGRRLSSFGKAVGVGWMDLRNCAKSGMAALWHLCTATMSPI